MEVIKNTEEFNQTLSSHKSVFVDFYADWCGPCKMVSPIVEQLAGENNDVTFVKVNVDDNPDIAEKYGIMSIPALFSFKNGEVAANTVGFQPKESLQKLVDAAK